MLAQHDALEILTANLGNLPGATGPACYLDRLSFDPMPDGGERLPAEFSVAKPLVRLLTDLTGAVRRKVTHYRGAEDTRIGNSGWQRRLG